MVAGALIAIILVTPGLLPEPVFRTGLLAVLLGGSAGAMGFAIRAAMGRREHADERDILILHRAGWYAWLFLFIAVPLLAIYWLWSPAPYGFWVSLGFYGAWLIAVIIFAATAIREYYK
jgi:hypothetical protein